MKTIAVTGGKGGTGKSTIAVSLSVVMSEKGRVLLTDADVECPNDHLIIYTKRMLKILSKLRKNTLKKHKS